MIARAVVLRSRPETPSTHSIRIEKPRGFAFRPVQFVGLEIETEEGAIEYPMSIASSPTRPYVEFGVRNSNSPWKRAFAALRKEDEVEIDGPYGHFILEETKPAILVAGGIGITPLKGMLEYATDKKLEIPVRLLYSNKTPKEIVFRPEIDELAAANPHARVVHTLTQDAGPDWTGRRGRIDAELLREVAEGTTDPTYYVCGKPAMVEGVARLLLSMRVPRERIRYEAFSGYA